MKADILGVLVDTLTFDETFETAMEFLASGEAHTVYTPNPEMVMEAGRNKAFREVLNSGSLVIPDGIGVVYASRLGREKIKERVTGYDLTLALFKRIKDTGHSVYLFGAAPGVAVKAKACLEQRYPGIKIVGTSDGFYDSVKEAGIINDIKEKKPDILIVGTGMVRQETWINEHKSELGAKLLIGAGGAIDHYAGNIRRAPQIWRKLGLEWLYRMFSLKRFKRQKQIPLFIFAVIKQKFSKGTIS